MLAICKYSSMSGPGIFHLHSPFLLPFLPRHASLPQVFYVNRAKEQTQEDQDVQYLDKTKGMLRHKIDIWVWKSCRVGLRAGMAFGFEV